MVETPEHDMAGPSRQVGDVDQVKVFSDSDAAEGGLNDPEGVAFDYEVLVR